MNFIKKTIIVLAVVFFVGTGVSYAQTATTTSGTTSSLAEQIATLLQQVSKLQNQLAELRAKQSDLQADLREAISLTRSLAAGASGDDVKALQEILASDPDIYPEGLVTGFYGPLTERAIKRLQEKFGLEPVGFVGPQTRGILNQLFKERGKGKSNILNDIIFKQDDLDDDDIDLSQFIPGTTGVLVCHMPPGNLAAKKTIAIGGPAVRAHLAHGDKLGACDDDDSDEDEENSNSEEAAEDAIEDAKDEIEKAEALIEEAEEDGEAVEESEELLADAKAKLAEAEEALEDDDFKDAIKLAEMAEDLAKDAKNAIGDEDETAPVISDIDVSDVASSTATITWETDEDSDSTVWYSTDSDFEIDDDDVEKVDDSDNVTDHSIELTDLDPDTTYYFIIGSEDEDGNEAMSDEESFTTDEE